MTLLKHACLFAVLIATYAFAEEEAEQERWFQVEIMIFKNPTIEADNPEAWPTYADIEHPSEYIRLEGVSEILTSNSDTAGRSGDIEPERSIELDSPVSKDGLEAFKALSEYERQLVSQQEKIVNDSRYELLFHEAWNQPVPNRDAVIPIRIDGGERFGRQSELQGYIDLYVERYLHINANLHLITYKKSNNPFAIVEENSPSPTRSLSLNSIGGLNLLSADLSSNSQLSRNSEDFFVSVQHAQLKESRRMRSRELHYFDNPEFGMLVLITPIEIQQ